MPTVISPQELKARFTGFKVNLIYQDSIDLYAQLRVHADGEMPIRLIREQRPNESDAVQKYRQSIYEPETQNPIEKVLGVLEKIRRSPDWMMQFSDDIPPIINEEETLEIYLTKKYPIYDDIEYWLFEEVLRTLGLDANAVIAVLPKDFAQQEGTEYMQPIGQVFNSPNVIEFIPEDYAVLKSDELSSMLSPERQMQIMNNQKALQTLTSGANTFSKGQVYYVITTSSYQKWEEAEDGKYLLTNTIMHGLNELPVFQVPGKFMARRGPYTLKKTPLFPMVPHLNKAARESNDLDAGVIMHLYLEKWRVNNIPCTDCHGTGQVAGADGPTTCHVCKGTGYATGKSPFNEILIRPQGLGEGNIPTPPVGYVDKNPEILKVQNDRIELHLRKALAAVNMEHLSETGMNQSGTAKAYDQDEVNNVIYTFAGMLVSVANTTAYFINELRYKNIVPNEDDRKAMLPIIPIPEKYDVVSTSYLFSEYQTAKSAGINPIILTEMQKEIGAKKFYANPTVADFVNTVMNLDPFPDKTTEEKGQMESQGLAAKIDVVLSNYINDFVRRAMEEDKDFAKKSDAEKREVLEEYAAEKVEELSAASQIKTDLFGDEEPPADEEPPEGVPPVEGEEPEEEEVGKPAPPANVPRTATGKAPFPAAPAKQAVAPPAK